jgi:16S rRNA (guanine966-N2)-methyltransferase
MRIIGGQCKGQQIISPKGSDVRPTSDRVKEAVFNTIQKRVPGSIVIDLFAGAGSLGIEALSRYAGKAYFVDHSPNQIQLIRKNLIKTGLMEGAEVLGSEVGTALLKLSARQIYADIIFMDPPYGQDFIEKTLILIDQNRVLHRDGIIVTEFGNDERIPEKTNHLQLLSIRKYGSTGIAYYSWMEEANDEKSDLSRQF